MKNQYIVFSPQGENPPTRIYNYRWQADREAKRLSVEHPNQVFNVCKIKSTAVNGQAAYFGKWRPNKTGASKRKPETQGIKLYRRPSGSNEPWTPCGYLSELVTLDGRTIAETILEFDAIP